MKAVIQRVTEAQVSVNQQLIGEIQQGFLILLGIHEADNEEDVDYLVRKIATLRVFSDHKDKMNLSIREINGSILSISQFTLYAETKKGNRPSFVKAARPEQAKLLYENFNNKLRDQQIEVATGEFGGDMAVSLVNDGPVTIIIDSHHK